SHCVHCSVCFFRFFRYRLDLHSFPTRRSSDLVTPSLVMCGDPKERSITTLRPLGPSVTFTASARVFTPAIIFERAESPNFTSLADIFDSVYCCIFTKSDLARIKLFYRRLSF